MENLKEIETRHHLELSMEAGTRNHLEFLTKAGTRNHLEFLTGIHLPCLKDTPIARTTEALMASLRCMYLAILYIRQAFEFVHEHCCDCQLLLAEGWVVWDGQDTSDSVKIMSNFNLYCFQDNLHKNRDCQYQYKKERGRHTLWNNSLSSPEERKFFGAP